MSFDCGGRFPNKDDDDYFNRIRDLDAANFQNVILDSEIQNHGIYFGMPKSINDYISTQKNYVIGHYGNHWHFNDEDKSVNVPFRWLEQTVGNGKFYTDAVDNNRQKLEGPGYKKLSDTIAEGTELPEANSDAFTTHIANHVKSLKSVWDNGGVSGAVFFNDKCGRYGSKGPASPPDLGQSYHSGHFTVRDNQISLDSIGQQMRNDLQIGFSSVYLSPGMKIRIKYGNHRVINTKGESGVTNYANHEFNNFVDYMCANEYNERFLNEYGVQFDGYVFEAEATTTGKYIDFGAIMMLYHQYDLLGTVHWLDTSGNIWDDIADIFNDDTYGWVALTPTVCARPKANIFQISELRISKTYQDYNEFMFNVCKPFSTGLRLTPKTSVLESWKPQSFNCDVLMEKACSTSTDPVCDCFNEQRVLDVTYETLDYPVNAACMGGRCGSSSVYKTAEMVRAQSNCNDLCIQLIEQSGKDVIQESDQLAACGGATYQQDGQTQDSFGHSSFDPITDKRVDISNYLLIGSGAFLAIVLAIGLIMWIIRRTRKE